MNIEIHDAALVARIQKQLQATGSAMPFICLSLETSRAGGHAAGPGPFLFPSDKNLSGHQKNLKTVCSTYATRLSACGVGGEWVTQLLRQ